MNRPRAFRSVPGEPNLRSLEEDRRPTFWTRALGDPPEVYAERLAYRADGTYRRWDPTRSKLASALVNGYAGVLPRPGERWLYLGAASGTTASHVADLLGPEGAVFAVEKSPRPFARLLRTAERYPNLLPVLGDARRPEEFSRSVPIVDGLYLDIPQIDQVAIARARAARAQDREHGTELDRPGPPRLNAADARGVRRGRVGARAGTVPPAALLPRDRADPPVVLRGAVPYVAPGRPPRWTTTVTTSSSARPWSRPTV